MHFPGTGCLYFKILAAAGIWGCLTMRRATVRRMERSTGLGAARRQIIFGVFGVSLTPIRILCALRALFADVSEA